MNDDEVAKVQKSLEGTFNGFKFVIALLLLCFAVAICFAVHYSS